jgi:hypothetical protein
MEEEEMSEKDIVFMEVTLEERQILREYRKEQDKRNARLKAQQRLAWLHEELHKWLSNNGVSLGLKWRDRFTAELMLEDNETRVERVLGDELG